MIFPAEPVAVVDVSLKAAVTATGGAEPPGSVGKASVVGGFSGQDWPGQASRRGQVAPASSADPPRGLSGIWGIAFCSASVAGTAYGALATPFLGLELRSISGPWA